MDSATFHEIFAHFIGDKEQDGKRDQQEPYVRADAGKRQGSLHGCLSGLSSVPPPSAQGHEEGDGILQALGLRLEITDPRLMVLSVRNENLQVIDDAGLIIRLDEPERFLGRFERLGLGVQGFGVMFQCPQGIGNLGKSTEDGLAVGGQRLLVPFKGRLSLEPQRPAMEQGGSNVRTQAPEIAAALEEAIHRRVVLPVGAIQRKARKQCGSGYADFRAGAVQLRLGGKNIGALAHQFRREGYRQLTGKRKVGQINVWRSPFRGCTTDQGGKEVLGLAELLLQGREQRLKRGQLTPQG